MISIDKNSTSCAQSEAEYRATEKQMIQDWNQEKAIRDQMLPYRIPGWLNAPQWANWIQFCTRQGWVFTEEKQPFIYPDGHMDVAVKSVRACDVPGVMFF